MAQTMDYEITSDDWSTVSELGSAFIQLKTNGPVILHVGSAAPDEAPFPGIVLEGNKLNAFALDGLEPTDLVSLRAMDNDVERVCILSTAHPEAQL